jgi:hypothetical protein
MSAGLLMSFVVSFAIGWFVVALIWSGSVERTLTHDLLMVLLGFGLGQGLTSCIAFVYLLLHGRASGPYYLVELALLVCLLLLFALSRRHKRERVPLVRSARPERSPGVRRAVLLPLTFYATASMALATVALRLWQVPHGGYDAWAIWNSRARALSRSGDGWRDTIFNAAFGHVHLDYPLLLPVSVTRAWMYAGGETTLAPALLAWLFTATTLALLVCAVAALCGRMHAYVAGLVLMGYTFFVLHGNSELAEAPLISFYLATFVLIAFHNAGVSEGRRLLVLAGVAGGLAAWTKNEGLLFLLALAIAHFAVVIFTRGPKSYAREVLAFVTGLAPVAALIVYFKTQIAPPNVWIAGMSTPVVTAQAVDPGRYMTIARALTERLILYSGPGVNLAYLLVLFLVCFGVARRHIPSVIQAALTLGIMFAGFIGVYVLTLPNVASFVSGSMDRLLLQLWPGFVLGFFLLVRPVDSSMAVSGPLRASAPSASDGS